jgi:hypothetical protein
MKREPSPRLRTILLVAVAASLLAFLQFFQPPGHGKVWLAAMDAGHVPLFGVFALVTLGVVRAVMRGRAVHPLLPYALAFVITAVVSALVEVLQFYGPRDADPVDLARSVSGALIFLSAVLAIDRGALPSAPGPRAMLRAMLVLMAVVLLVVSLATLTRLVRADMMRAAAFPHICDFESSWEAEFYDTHDADLLVVALPGTWRTEPKGKAGRLTFHPGTYPGLHINEVHPDWRGYDRLCMDVYSEEPSSRELVVRVHDREHNNAFPDRFNGTIIIRPGVNRISIPLSEVRTAPEGREMDMAHIHGLSIFAVRPDTAFTVYLDAIRLEED